MKKTADDQELAVPDEDVEEMWGLPRQGSPYAALEDGEEEWGSAEA